MKKVSFFFVCLMVVLLGFSALPAIGQTKSKPTKHRVVKKVDPLIAEAEKAWASFWPNFKTAIKTRDLDSLKPMVSKDYRCTSRSAYARSSDSECACENFADRRDSFFCEYRVNEMWDGFNFIFQRSLRLGKIQKTIEGIEREVSRENGNGARDWLQFRFGNDGIWYFVGIFAGGYV